MEDRAAVYSRETNTILANLDFRVFTDMIEHFTKEYSQATGTGGLIRDVVCEWFEQQLVEAVMGAQALRGSREWSDDDFDKCVSEEALSLAVMPRWHVFVAIKRSLGTKLGALKT